MKKGRRKQQRPVARVQRQQARQRRKRQQVVQGAQPTLVGVEQPGEMSLQERAAIEGIREVVWNPVQMAAYERAQRAVWGVAGVGARVRGQPWGGYSGASCSYGEAVTVVEETQRVMWAYVPWWRDERAVGGEIYVLEPWMDVLGEDEEDEEDPLFHVLYSGGLFYDVGGEEESYLPEEAPGEAATCTYRPVVAGSRYEDGYQLQFLMRKLAGAPLEEAAHGQGCLQCEEHLFATGWWVVCAVCQSRGEGRERNMEGYVTYT